MFQQLTAAGKTAVLASSMILAAVALVFSLDINIAPSYADFIVGHITWRAETKLQDLIAGPLFILVLCTALVGLSWHLARHRIRNDNAPANGLAEQLLWCSIPGAVAISGLLITDTLDPKLIYFSATAILFIAFATLTPGATKLTPKDVGLTVLSTVLIALLPMEAALVLGRVSSDSAGSLAPDSVEDAAYVVFAGGLLAALICALRWPQLLLRSLPTLLLIGQLGLSSLFITLLPAALLQPDGTVAHHQTTIGLTLLVIAMVAGGIFDVVRRYRRHSRAQHPAQLLSPMAFFALLVAIKVGDTIGPIIGLDDYHLGESMLGWWSYLQGSIPYVDYVPAHGLIGNDLRGLLSVLFYDGSAASLPDAMRLTTAILAFIAFISIYSFSGSLGLAFVCTFFLDRSLNWLFLTPFLCLWLSTRLRATPARWLGVWLFSVPIVILGVPPQGVVLVAASGILAASCFWMLLQDWQHTSLKPIGLALGVLSVVALLMPLIPMLFGAIRYVLENGVINQVAYGIPWNTSWIPEEHQGIVFELIRMSWAALPIACLAVVYLGTSDQAARQRAILPALMIALIVLLLVPYSMGRINTAHLTRPGAVAIFGWAVLLPLVAWGVVKPANRPLLILGVAVISGSLTMVPLSVSPFFSTTSAHIEVGQLRDGSGAGLPNIGTAVVEEDHWRRLVTLNTLMQSRLAPEESYLDLTSRNAHYFYLGRLPPVAVTAPYNMVPLGQQQRAVERLSANVPKIALLEGQNLIFDGGGLALRNPILYRFALENYIPSLENGFIVGYRKHDLTGPMPDKETTLALFQQAFSRWDLGKIPVAWGRSTATLSKRMSLVGDLNGLPTALWDLTSENDDYKIAGADPHLSFDISHLRLPGRDAGLLKLDFACVGETMPPRIQVFWWGDEQQRPSEASSLRFTAANGTLIVPLDSSPRWLMAEHLKGIRIDLDNASACTSISVKNVGLYQRDLAH